MVGVVHVPAYQTSDVGVVVVVGGPQYRVGSHRQFVLLGRSLAEHGIPVLRFDYSGMGDSGGEPKNFEHVEEDIGLAIDLLLEQAKGLRKICLWGLCDAASAALMYGFKDDRVSKLVLLNPWVRTESGLAQAYLENYYGRRLRSGAFWRKILGNPAAALRSARDYVANLVSARSATRQEGTRSSERLYLDRMLEGAERFEGSILILLSGRDTVATEFELTQQNWPAWAKAFQRPGIDMHRLDAADHTFSRREWRDWVAEQTAGFLSRDQKP